MKLLILSVIFFMFMRMASWFGDSVKKGIAQKQSSALDELEKQIHTREIAYQELQRGEKIPFKMRKAIQLGEWDELSKIIDEVYSNSNQSKVTK